MIYTSIRQMKLVAKYKWCNLTKTQQKQIKKHDRQEIACKCNYGYTQYALYNTCIGLVLVEGYSEYCDILHSL